MTNQEDAHPNRVKRLTLYLPFGVHEKLREVAFARRINQQDIMRAALDLWLAKEGLGSWDEAKKAGDNKLSLVS